MRDKKRIDSSGIVDGFFYYYWKKAALLSVLYSLGWAMISFWNYVAIYHGWLEGSICSTKFHDWSLLITSDGYTPAHDHSIDTTNSLPNYSTG